MEKLQHEITATELKTNLGRYLDHVALGNEVVITKNGESYVRMSPYISDMMKYLMVRETMPSFDAGSKLVSYEEFQKISDSFEGRMEYINGEIILQATPNSFHQEVVGDLYVFLKNYFKGRSCKPLLAPFDVTLYKIGGDTPDVVQPDLLVICDASEKINEKGRYEGIPTLVIEVLSPSTRSKDMVSKLNTYMLGGCREYWIVDVIRKQIIFYSFKDYEVDSFETLSLKKTLYSQAFEGLSIALETVFESIL